MNIKFLSLGMIASLIMTMVSCDLEEYNGGPINPAKDLPFAIPYDFVDTIEYQLKNGVKGSDWMSRLDGNRKVNKVSIPGAHDALTGMGFYEPVIKPISNLLAISQLASLEMQLDGGVRFFDIRPVVGVDSISQKKVLRCAHGISEIALTLDEVTERMKAFLDQHPKEFIIVKMQHDKGLEDQMPWLNLMGKYFKKYNSYFADWRPDITVDEVRGKILVLGRIMYPVENFRGVYVKWMDENADLKENNPVNYAYEFGCEMTHDPELFTDDDYFGVLPSPYDDVYPMYVQDYFKSDKPERVKSKKEAVMNMLEATDAVFSDPSDNTWIINHCSAYTMVSPRGYCENAEQVHPDVIEYLATTGKPAGILVVDFAGFDHVDCVINGGNPYFSEYMYDKKPKSQSLINLVIMSNF